ncbi:MAG: hypothetical protein GF419_09865 [Ignavibacteriales bacterium]|jgi:hypothetical protein|nr:hypothetical protein [Ignavibacteriales bacterium]
MTAIELLSVILAIEVGLLAGLAATAIYGKGGFSLPKIELKPLRALRGASLSRMNLQMQRAFAAWMDGK